jgi:hypothetical protein
MNQLLQSGANFLPGDIGYHDAIGRWQVLPCIAQTGNFGIRGCPQTEPSAIMRAPFDAAVACVDRQYHSGSL